MNIEVHTFKSPLYYFFEALFIAFQIFSEVAGIEISFTQSSDKASTTALITAGGEPIAPTSPHPFTPKEL